MVRDDFDAPRYVISIAARILGVHAQTLRYYEKVGLVEPSRSPGNIRLYSARDVEKLKRIKGLLDDLGVNLAGVEVIIGMMEKMTQMEMEIQRLTAEVQQLRDRSRGDTR